MEKSNEKSIEEKSMGMGVRYKLMLSSIGIMLISTVWLCIIPFVFSCFLGVNIEETLNLSASSLGTIGTVSAAAWAIIKWQSEKNKENLMKRIDQVYIPLRALFANINAECNIYGTIVKNDNLERGFKELDKITSGNKGQKFSTDNYTKLYNKLIQLPDHYMSIRMLDHKVMFCNIYVEFIQSASNYQEESNDILKGIKHAIHNIGERSPYFIMDDAGKELHKLFQEIESICLEDLNKYQQKLELD